MNLQLSATQQDIFNRLDQAGDVAISALYQTVFKRQAGDAMTVRDQQQRLGPYFVSLNVKLEKHGRRVIPGRLKNTYRLSKIND